MYKIICKRVPEELLKKEAARNHFRQFGRVKRIVFRSLSKVIMVEYGSKESMEKAIKFGNCFANKTFNITEEQTEPMEKSLNKKLKSKMAQKNLPDEVMAELDAMGGGPSLALINKPNVKLEGMKDEPKKSLKRRVALDKDKGVSKKNKPIVFTKSKEYIELLEITKQRAMTIEEKYKVLDARDKILRMIQKENGTKKGFTEGTCPDMCPEKERLLRVIQHQVAAYEQNSSKEMDPYLAVKQYSRSSADQESPLPHELRPVSVLQATMSYLIHKIMPMGEMPQVNIGEWFHFLWDRTRSIRKDITQQASCCKGSVELLEQCARFHIHCSARLVAEDPSVFDQKINTENLTKCLQTLKYMYNDLRLKGEKCPNEPEFRGYIILLNLNDANFMWEVQRLPIEIQQSKEIKEAIRIYSAVNADNFVRFFKLVRNTSYLNACILMRYFMQVRYRGLDIILKCFTPRITKAVYPLDAVIRNFGFESDTQTIEFMQNFGLKMNDSATGFILDKSASFVQDINYTTLERSINLVESKRGHLSLGMIVNGGLLPSFISLEPQSSFDEDGFLKEKPVFVVVDKKEDQTDQEIQELVPDFTKTVDDVEEPSKPEELHEEKKPAPIDYFSTGQNFFSYPYETHLKSFSEEKSLFEDVNVQNKPRIETSKLQRIGETVDAIISIDDEVFNIKNSTPEPNQWSFTEDDLSMMNRERRKSKIATPSPLPFAFSFTGPLSSQRISTYMRRKEDPEINKMEIEKEEEEERKLQSPIKRKEPPTITKESTEKELFYLNYEVPQRIEQTEETDENSESPEVLHEEIKSILSEIINSVVKLEQKTKEEEHLKYLMELKRIKRVLRKWRNFVIKKRRERSANGLNKYLNGTDLKEGAIAYALQSSGILRKSLKIKFSPDIWAEKTVNLEKYAKILAEKYESFKGIYTIGPSNPIYWKCLISVATKYELNTDFRTVCGTLQNYFRWDEGSNQLLKQTFYKNVPVRFSIENEIGLGSAGTDANGLIFIDRNLNQNLYQRIQKKFQNTGVFVSLPIVIILQEAPNENTKLTNFDSLVEQGIISGYYILHGYVENGLTNLVDKALQYLADKVNPPPPIEVDHLENILFRNFLYSEMWKTASCYGKSNPHYGACLKDPNTVFNVYNDGLKKLKDIITDDSCYEFSRFPNEFKQFEETMHVPCDYKYLPEINKDADYKNYIINVFNKLMPLRPFSSWPPRSEQQFLQVIEEFCSNNFGDSCYRITNALLAKLWQIGHGSENGVPEIFWTDLMEMIVAEKYRLYKLFTSLCEYKKEWMFYNSVVVVYHKQALTKFQKSNWFYLTNPVIARFFEKGFEPDSSEKSADQEEPSKNEVDEIIARARNTLSAESNLYVNLDMRLFQMQLEDIDDSISVTRRITSKFEEHFKNHREQPITYGNE